jgi:hypothetical protein
MAKKSIYCLSHLARTERIAAETKEEIETRISLLTAPTKMQVLANPELFLDRLDASLRAQVRLEVILDHLIKTHEDLAKLTMDLPRVLNHLQVAEDIMHGLLQCK